MRAAAWLNILFTSLSYLTKLTVRITQHMVFEGGPNKGKPKGLRIVCEERFGPDFVKGLLLLNIITDLDWVWFCQL